MKSERKIRIHALRGKLKGQNLIYSQPYTCQNIPQTHINSKRYSKIIICESTK